MNDETKDSVSRALEILRGHLSAIDGNKTSVASARTVAAELETRRSTIVITGTGRDQLPGLMAEIGRNNEHINKLGIAYQEQSMALNTVLWPIYPLANTVLSADYNQKFAAAISRIRPHVETDRDAEKEAENSVECRALRRAISSLGVSPWDKAEGHARTIVQYFEAALQSS